MKAASNRRALVFALAALAMALLLGGAHLIGKEIDHAQQHFTAVSEHIRENIANRLSANDAVLAGFVSFLQAVEISDHEAATRFAATALENYPHIYMMEVARKLRRTDEQKFVDYMRKHSRQNFALKNFSEIKNQPATYSPTLHTWPIIFLHPSLPEVEAIYGLRLETVDYLYRSMTLAHGVRRPIASPVFDMYEGGRAYLLLQEAIRPAPADPRDRQPMFGDTMLALLLIRGSDLKSAMTAETGSAEIALRVFHPDLADKTLFEITARPPEKTDTLFLPLLKHEIHQLGKSQPLSLQIEQQLRWSYLLDAALLTKLALLLGAFGLCSWMLVRYAASLERLAQEHERNAYLATHDVLTGLPNRYLFNDRIKQAFAHWQRNRVSFALMMVDIDNFKDINDRYGHEAGDEVLAAMAMRLKSELRACDTVARLGGDELIVLLTSVLNEEELLHLGEKLRRTAERPVDTAAGLVPVSCSIGIALCPKHGESPDALRRAADQAMYAAKQSGRNTVSVATAG